jgi:hypothetical protein
MSAAAVLASLSPLPTAVTPPVREAPPNVPEMPSAPSAEVAADDDTEDAEDDAHDAQAPLLGSDITPPPAAWTRRQRGRAKKAPN